MSRPTTKVAQVDATLVGRSCQTRGEVQCLVELGPGHGGLLAHVAKNGDLGPRGDQRVGDSIDPDSGAAAIAAFIPCDSLERKNAVRPRKLAEAQSHHAGVRRHLAILTSLADFSPAPPAPLTRGHGPLQPRDGLVAADAFDVLADLSAHGPHLARLLDEGWQSSRKRAADTCVIPPRTGPTHAAA